MTDLKNIVMKGIIEATATEQPIYKFILLIPEISCHSMSEWSSVRLAVFATTRSVVNVIVRAPMVATTQIAN